MQDEGNLVKEFFNTTHKNCLELCDKNKDDKCNSFGYCPNFKNGGCYLYDKILKGTEALTNRQDCYSNYRSCKGISNTSEIMIYHFMDYDYVF